MCSLTISKDEIQNNKHHCFNSLIQHLAHMLKEKDRVIDLLRDEVSRKNQNVVQLIDRQNFLEQKLQMVEGVL